MAGRGRGKKAQQQVASACPSPTAYAIDMTKSAEDIYVGMARRSKEAERAGDYANNHCTTFNMVREAIKRTIANDPLNKKFALRGELSNIFRIRKGRIRICWIASSKLRRVLILFIAETLRKEGDANDPYVISQNMMDAGKFDELFRQFGVRMARLRHEGHSGKPH